MAKKLFLLLFFSLLTVAISAQDSAYARKVMNHLCKNKFHGRGYYNNGAVKAGKYIAQQMRKAGLQSPNATNHYLQKYGFYVNQIKETQLVFNGKILVEGRDYLFPPCMQTSSGVAQATAIISEKTLKDTNWFKSMVQSARSQSEGAYYENFILIDTLSAETEKKYKSDIDLIIRKHKTVQLKRKLTYSASTNSCFWTEIQILYSAVAGFWDHSGVKLDYKAKSKFGTTQQHNVVGLVKGTLMPDSFIVVTAHYDHLGQMGKAVFPGANDNACGVAMMLDLAKYYAKNPQKYTLVFIAFSGEEAGLLGSKYYTENPIHPLLKTRFLLNLDLVGSGETGMTVVNATAFPKEFSLLDSINRAGNYLPAIRKRGKAANSDHYYFTEMGIPSFFWYLSGPRTSYHDIDDVPSTVTMAKYTQTTLLIQSFFKALQ